MASNGIVSKLKSSEHVGSKTSRDECKLYSNLPNRGDPMNQSPTERMRPHLALQTKQDLPVDSYKDSFFKILNESPSVLVIGETGSGKSTQIPQWCVEYCQRVLRIKKPLVGCTQPRRVAAMSIATRVANERASVVGSEVGYNARFEHATSPHTRLIYLTDGMLLREASFLPDLSRYNVIILDEAHERTLQTEILFGVVKRALEERKKSKKDQFKVVIMSATINVKLFKNYFDAPLLRIEGRQHPVQNLTSDVPQSDILTSVLTCVFQIHRNCDDGDILVFCAGQDEIQSLIILTKYTLKYAANQPNFNKSMLNLIPLPLYATLPVSQQMLVFDRERQIELKIQTGSMGITKPNGGNSKIGFDDSDESDDNLESNRFVSYDSPTKFKNIRRVIYATNVAETSVTIPFVKYVIDTGKFKCKKFCPKTGLESLKVTNISKAQAQQRSGRAGRVAPGTCYRLYTAEDYDQMPDFNTPEIKRCNLDSVLLQLIRIDSSFIRTFEFLERPDDERIVASLRNLLSLKAIMPVDAEKQSQSKNKNTNSSMNGISPSTSSIESSSPTDNKNLTRISNDLPRNIQQTIAESLADDGALLKFDYDLTSLGLKLSMFPLHPSMTRVLFAAHDLGCLDEALTIVSLLSVESIFHVPTNKQGQADAVLSKFHSNEGDTIMLLNVYRAFRRTFTIDRKNLKQWCVDHFIHIKNLKTARLIRKQISQIARSQFNLQSSTCSQDTSLVRRALAYGLYNNVATMWDGKYRSKSSAKEIFIHPNSCLFKIRPECIIYAEVVETNKCYMRNCTLVDANWFREFHSPASSSKF